MLLRITNFCALRRMFLSCFEKEIIRLRSSKQSEVNIGYLGGFYNFYFFQLKSAYKKYYLIGWAKVESNARPYWLIYGHVTIANL